MTDEIRVMLIQFFEPRRAIVKKRIEATTQHKELCGRLAISKNKVDELFARFSVEEQQIINDHYENEHAKNTDFSDDAYIQGLRDSFMFYELLGFFGSEDGI